MGKPPISYYVREWIAGIAFSVFLWAVRMSEEEYFAEIVRSSESDNA